MAASEKEKRRTPTGSERESLEGQNMISDLNDKDRQISDLIEMWLAIGIAVGAGIGLATSNLAIGVVMGVGVGVAIGAGLRHNN
jgi:hypothetical protein